MSSVSFSFLSYKRSSRNLITSYFILVSIVHILILEIKCQSDVYPSPIKKVKFQMPTNYDKEMRPATFGEAVSVETDIHVQAINPIKAADMDFRMEMVMSQQWVDLRLNFSNSSFFDSDFIILPIEFIDKIWHPDPYIVNAKSTEVGQLTQKLVKVYIFKNQTVAYSTNMFVTVACSMQFHFYPYDFQICPMIIESFSYDETRVKYSWSKSEAFTINPKLRLLQFQVTYPLFHDEISIPRVKADKNYSQLIAYFRFDRLLGNHLIQTFAPCSLIVCLSWFSFWLELDAISARVSVLVTSMLTLVTQFSGLKAEFPPVAYVKAVDIWMGGCLIFVFAALGEFVFVKVIYVLTEEARTRTLAKSVNGPDWQSTDTSVYLPTPSASSPINTRVPFQQHSKDIIPPDDGKGTSNEAPMNTTAPIDYHQDQHVRLRSQMMKVKNQVAADSPDVRLMIWKRFNIDIPLVWTNSKTNVRHTLWKVIDNFSRWGFPMTFCFFLCVYWVYLYTHSTRFPPGRKVPV